MMAEFQPSSPSAHHQLSSLDSIGKERAVLQFTATAPPGGGGAPWLPADNGIITITDVALIKKIEELIKKESKENDKVVKSPVVAPPANGDDKKFLAWSPIDDGIITTSDVASTKKIEKHIDNVLYGSKKILRRLPVFEEITPS